MTPLQPQHGAAELARASSPSRNIHSHWRAGRCFAVKDGNRTYTQMEAPGPMPAGMPGARVPGFQNILEGSLASMDGQVASEGGQSRARSGPIPPVSSLTEGGEAGELTVCTGASHSTCTAEPHNMSASTVAVGPVSHMSTPQVRATLIYTPARLFYLTPENESSKY